MSHESPAVSKARAIQTNLIQSHYLTGTSKVLQLLWRTWTQHNKKAKHFDASIKQRVMLKNIIYVCLMQLNIVIYCPEWKTKLWLLRVSSLKLQKKNIFHTSVFSGTNLNRRKSPLKTVPSVFWRLSRVMVTVFVDRCWDEIQFNSSILHQCKGRNLKDKISQYLSANEAKTMRMNR